ncbi:UDP-N-acetylmuramate:L-alanyl-gamma-D-glutamyl-meso-diaminopimelate ligase [Larsenimonas suaedae]|uniref:UDP-N-acetylmuramate--L-alanyl-gamma-D-glutamyl-meso-2,6-diaminoheptandioate ligase n=1 Tax=Larsenimonas suaedae TaxID=1851019 RepID=A0ABU1GWM9_9GAMM|nr:UDP-N-acetylmuramate:L-alanyl-gamma-D-glutamyl-meso-diaminopimelate ligase [Larsenimonas suaedae]MCM2971243.1 UDP-N-acetylmuramate:L-alanyl-gamma-D-glutamyl-meso-diaminopimelate ligase [Larsenimonas suaedae]MDR5895952.1 UDP-N-acetylmuramate:L-alanyl-gamma-D-glutamyl-meso-diaminopimelate ligase [Larsenimonas suaedae]
MHVHILGICGTFMGSLALLAKARGDRVTGSDAKVYPPMSTQLEAQGIELLDGFDPAHLDPTPDLVIIGNALSRGNPEVEAVLDRKLPYTSGPEWLARHVLPGHTVLAVAGTHGKTTTSSMLAWILEHEGLAPGFLIGGVPDNFGLSARLAGGDKPMFVVEADEYDTAFFDKRSKLVHYRPDVAVLNNLEFDHADIFPDLAAIERQFHHLVRTVPGKGRLVVADDTPALDRVLALGAWTPIERFGSAGSDWQVSIARGGRSLTLYHAGASFELEWTLSGAHNAQNALAALAAAYAVGVPVSRGVKALHAFKSPKRRQEVRGEVRGVMVIDDFAHHPTAIAATLDGLKSQSDERGGRLWAVIEPRSNTMRLGTMKERLNESVVSADGVWWYQPPTLDWSLEHLLDTAERPAEVHRDIDALVERVCETAEAGDVIVVMSNGGFEGVHERLLKALATRSHID